MQERRQCQCNIPNTVPGGSCMGICNPTAPVSTQRHLHHMHLPIHIGRHITQQQHCAFHATARRPTATSPRRPTACLPWRETRRASNPSPRLHPYPLFPRSLHPPRSPCKAPVASAPYNLPPTQPSHPCPALFQQDFRFRRCHTAAAQQPHIRLPQHAFGVGGVAAVSAPWDPGCAGSSWAATRTAA